MKPHSNNVSSVELLSTEAQKRDHYNQNRNDHRRGRNAVEADVNTHGQNSAHISDSCSSTWLRNNNAINENPVKSSQSAGPNYCFKNNAYVRWVISFGIISTAFSVVVLYVEVERTGTRCRCDTVTAHNYYKVSESAIKHENFPEVLEKMKAKIENDISDLQAKMSNFSKTTDEHRCRGTDKNCGKASVDRFSDKFRATENMLEGLYNKTEEDIKRHFEQTNIKVKEISTFNGKLNCSLNQAKKSSNGTLITVHVPKSSGDRTTLAVTCSTSLQHAADVRYLQATSEDQQDYTCYCTNRISKHTDCVAYFWQCKS